MLVDGRVIAAGILREVQVAVGAAAQPPRLAIVTCTPDKPTLQYLALKKQKATAVGINVNIVELATDCTTDDAKQTVARVADDCDGLVVQLPLPGQIDTDAVLAAIPASHDVDAVHYDGERDDVLPPVVGAIAEISKRHDVDWASQRVTVVGAGRLVGTPALLWATAQGAEVTVVTAESDPVVVSTALQSADIIVSGAGVPGLITTDRIKPGVIVFDAGTSEDAGELRGDVEAQVADVAALLTPVPGGIGPITVAYLLKNLITLTRQ